MKFSNTSKKVITTLALITLAGCASYNAQPLSSLIPTVSEQKNASADKVLVMAHAFNEQECETYLDRDVIAEGYRPVQIYIENKSDKYLSFNTSQINMPCANEAQVADLVHTNTTGRVVGWGVGSLILWPLVIPAIVDGVGSSNANKKLDQDFSEKALSDGTIAPHSVLNGLVFVPNNQFRSDMKISLTDQTSNESKTFLVDAGN